MRIRFAPFFAVPSLVFLAACATEWTAQPLPQGPGPDDVPATRLRVTRTSGEVIELSAGAVRGDSLLGFRADSVSDPRIALPLSEVARVEAARTNTTVPALIGLGAAAVLWRWIVFPALVGD
jgi:hypothetical protein